MRESILKQIVLYKYRYKVAYFLLSLTALYFLFWRLGDLTGGLAAVELQSARHSLDLTNFISDPVSPIQTILQHISISIFGITDFSLRLPSALIGLALIATLYALMRRWLSNKYALASTLVLASSDWLLYQARLGTGSIELALLVSVSLLAIVKIIGGRSWWIVALALALSLMLFNPFGYIIAGVILLTIFSLSFFRDHIHDLSTWPKAIGFIILISSIISVSSIQLFSSGYLNQLLPLSWPLSLPIIMDNITNGLLYTFIRLPGADSLLGGSGTLLIRFFESAFFILGLALFIKNRRNGMNKLLLTLLTALIILVTLTGAVEPIMALSVINIIIIGAGMRSLISQWEKTFPRNYYARLSGYGLFVALLIAVIISHAVSYFNLWSTSQPVANTFSPDYTLMSNYLEKQLASGGDQSCIIYTRKDNTKLAADLYTSTNYDNCTALTADDDLATIDPDMSTLLLQDGQTDTEFNAFATPLVSDRHHDSLRWIAVENNN